MSMYLEMIPSITSSAPPPMEINRESLRKRQKKNALMIYFFTFLFKHLYKFTNNVLFPQRPGVVFALPAGVSRE